MSTQIDRGRDGRARPTGWAHYGFAQVERIVRDEFGGAAPSAYHVAMRYVSRNGHQTRRFGYAAVARALRRGVVRLDPEHPAASRHGRGAIVLP